GSVGGGGSYGQTGGCEMTVREWRGQREGRLSRRVSLGRLYLGLPERGGDRRGWTRPVDLGHFQPSARQYFWRRNRRCRLRPLSSLARGCRFAARARRRRLPAVDRLAAHRAGGPRQSKPQGPRIL